MLTKLITCANLKLADYTWEVHWTFILRHTNREARD